MMDDNQRAAPQRLKEITDFMPSIARVYPLDQAEDLSPKQAAAVSNLHRTLYEDGPEAAAFRSSCQCRSKGLRGGGVPLEGRGA